MKNFQFECWMTRWQIGTTSTSPTGERSHMSSKAMLRFAEEFRQARAVGGQAGEDEAAVAVDARRALHAAVGVVARHARAFVARGQRDRAHVAVEVEAPGVVRADEGAAGVALQVAHQLHAAVRAAVVEHLHAAVLLPHHDHRLAADGHGVVVAGFGHLRLVAAVDPGAFPDLLHLAIEDLLVGVDRLVHAVGFDEGAQVHVQILLGLGVANLARAFWITRRAGTKRAPPASATRPAATSSSRCRPIALLGAIDPQVRRHAAGTAAAALHQLGQRLRPVGEHFQQPRLALVDARAKACSAARNAPRSVTTPRWCEVIHTLRRQLGQPRQRAPEVGQARGGIAVVRAEARQVDVADEGDAVRLDQQHAMPGGVAGHVQGAHTHAAQIPHRAVGVADGVRARRVVVIGFDLAPHARPAPRRG